MSKPAAPNQSGSQQPLLDEQGNRRAPTVDSLIESGQAAERSGQRGEARAFYEAALYRLTRDDTPARAAAVVRWIARTHMMDGDRDAALDCADAALAISEACGDKAGEGHAINVKAAIYWKAGDLDAAEPLFLSARATALTAGERGLAAMTSANLGVIASIRGDLPEALHNFTVGLEHYRVLGLPTDICNALNNLGRLHTELRQWSDAEAAFNEAVEINSAVGDVSARIGLDLNRTEMWLARDEVARAGETLADALSLAQRTGDTSWLPLVSKLQGIIERDTGNPNEADIHFSRSLELAEARQDTLLVAETLRERAELHLGQGRNREALQSLNRSHRLFTQLRARRELANVDRSMGRLEGDFIDVVKRWGESIEAKDRYTQGHCVRVADLACTIAIASGIDEHSLFWFRIGALLHDVGKLVVPSEVLNKPGKLTDEEWALMKRHPSAGVEMLADIDFPWDVRPIIESHHERWDGRGYPHGLAGEDIPMSARILCVADVYDALTSARSYRAAMPHEEAMGIMRADVGKAFDPAVFALFEEALRKSQEQPTSGYQPVDAILPTISVPRPVGVQADLDALTGLPLRQPLERIAVQVLADRRATGGSASMVVIDIDATGFEGAAATDAQRDRLLRAVARQLRKQTRTTDFVARTGDRQFVALLRDASFVDAELVGSRVRAAITRVQKRNRGESVGGAGVRIAVVTAPGHGQTLDELFTAADVALARARGARTGGARALA